MSHESVIVMNVISRFIRLLQQGSIDTVFTSVEILLKGTSPSRRSAWVYVVSTLKRLLQRWFGVVGRRKYALSPFRDIVLKSDLKKK